MKDTMKKSFDEQFGDLSEQQQNVKLRVTQQLNHKKRPKPQWHYALVATIFLTLVGVLAWTQLNDTQMQTAHNELSVEEGTQLFTESYFNTQFYGLYYLAPGIVSMSDARLTIYDTIVEQQAIMNYAKVNDVQIDEQQLQQLVNEQLNKVTQQVQQDHVRAQYLRGLLTEFTLTEQAYVETIVKPALEAQLYKEAYMRSLGIEIDDTNAQFNKILQEAILLLEQQYGPQLNMFRQQQHVPQAEMTFKQTSMLSTEFGNYKIATVKGNEVFAADNELTISWTTGESVGADAFIDKIYIGERQSNDFPYFHLLSIDNYIDKAAQYGTAQQVEDFKHLMQIAKNTAALQ